MLSNDQERELEKVNAFYLQKEAEVRTIHPVYTTISSLNLIAQNTS